MHHRYRQRTVICLLLLILLLPAASLQAAGNPAATPTPLPAPLETIWELLKGVACEIGISIGSSNLCYETTAATMSCEKGITIDPNGGCTP